MRSVHRAFRVAPAVLGLAVAGVCVPRALGQVYQPAPVAVGAPAAAVRLTPEQLDQLTAPIALYPDPLIAQVLPAATYPTEVLAAAQFAASNPTMPDYAIDQQPWEPSVKAIAHYPEVLQLMN